MFKMIKTPKNQQSNPAVIMAVSQHVFVHTAAKKNL